MFSSWFIVMDDGKEEDRLEDLSSKLLLDSVSHVSVLSRWTCKINYPGGFGEEGILTGILYSFYLKK